MVLDRNKKITKAHDLW